VAVPRPAPARRKITNYGWSTRGPSRGGVRGQRMIMPPARASNVPEQRGRTTMKPYCHERQGDKERRGHRGALHTAGERPTQAEPGLSQP
jgi:hypothetical protein